MNDNPDETRSVESKVKLRKAVRIKEGKREEVEERVAQEGVLRILVNRQQIAALSCTPSDQSYLAVGFLFSEGIIRDKDQIRRIEPSEDRVTVHTDPSYRIPEGLEHAGILTSGCGKGKTLAQWEKIDPLEDVLMNLELVLSPDQIVQAMSQFEKRSHLFRQTAGVHSAALADESGIRLFNEDIGRHNAVDKVVGESLLKGVGLKDKFLVISGRISSDIVSKMWHCGLSIVVSRTAPTTLALDMASRLGITLVGFVRGRRMNVYSFPARVKE